MGSTVLDGAVIGDDSFIAAGSLVTPGTIIPAHSFVMGRPAKVVRPVRDADLVGIREAASRYVQYAQEFRIACKRIE
jgi:carbonic anhydrase/acetyltransferase-like protein (isoleucine patch superfamily)